MIIPLIISVVALLCACGSSGSASSSATSEAAPGAADTLRVEFDADSAYSYVARQVGFGPRVPNTQAHSECGKWLASELRRHGAKVTEQEMKLRAFDGTILDSRNIFGQYNPEAQKRVLLLAHWDCRPWADEDPDPANHSKPVDGANDGASGVGVLLEIARQLGKEAPGYGVDILFVDAEDWGTEGNDDSWALGASYFAKHPPVDGYSPAFAILLDMVGGKDAIFCREYFSEQSAPDVAQAVWAAAALSGYGHLFQNRLGSAVTDDHVKLIEQGIPAIDIIEYNPEGTGFNPRWHTLADNMDGIDPATLKAVGTTVMRTLRTIPER